MTTSPDDTQHAAPDNAFPYPLRGRDAGDYATLLVDWIRNHSSYLTVGDLASKLGRVAAFAGGTAANWLLLLPWMLLIAYGIAQFHFQILSHPLLSWLALTGVISIIVGGIFWTRGDDYAAKRWKPTSATTRTLGFMVLSSGIAVAVVMVPHAVEWLRDWYRVGRTAPLTAGGILGAVAASLGAVQSLMSGRMRWVLLTLQAMTAAVGILLLVGILLYLENFVVYGNIFRLVRWLPSSKLSPLNPLFAVAVASIALLCVIGRASFKSYRIFKRKPPFLCWTIGYQLGSYVAMIALWFLAGLFVAEGKPPFTAAEAERQLADIRDGIGRLTRPVSRLASYQDLDGLSSPIGGIFSQLRERRASMSAFYNLRAHGAAEAGPFVANRDDWAIDYFDAAQSFVDLGAEIGELKPTQLAELRLMLSESSRRELKSQLAERLDNPESINERLLEAIVAEAVYQREHERFDSLSKEPKSERIAKLRHLASPEYSKAILSELQQRRINAYHQEEYADLLARSEELPATFDRVGATIASRGDVPLLPAELQEEQQSELEERIRSEALVLFLSRQDASFREDEDVREIVPSANIHHEAMLVHNLRKLNRFQLVQLARQPLAEAGGDLPVPNEVEEWLRPASSRSTNDAASKDAQQERLEKVKQAALATCVRKALALKDPDRTLFLVELGLLSRPTIEGDPDTQLRLYLQDPVESWPNELVARGLMARFAMRHNDSTGIVAADDLVLAMRNGGVPLAGTGDLRFKMMQLSLWPKTHLLLFAGLLAIQASFFFDVNTNSMHGYYRNHLSHTFFISKPQVAKPAKDSSTATNLENSGRRFLPRSEHNFLLTDLSPPGCAAPYLIVNAALNLQAVTDPKLRDRKSDFWFFSKRYSGSERTSFVRSEILEIAHDKMQLSTAMAISAAAVSPNMGRQTNGFLVFMMSLLNVRLGYWVPKPSVFKRRTMKDASGRDVSVVRDINGVMEEEIANEVQPRWNVVYSDPDERQLRPRAISDLDDAGLIGLALSGGGIRSASFAMGVLQSLNRLGIFRHVDYLSTVSGGGYVGCGLSVSMASASQYQASPTGEPPTTQEQRRSAKKKPTPQIGGRPIRRRRLTPTYYLRELISNLHTEGAWVNLSDGGHIENLAAFELLRRRCQLIIVSDAEADSELTFNGLAALMRLARLELDTTVQIDVDAIRKRKYKDRNDEKVENQGEESASHFTVGRILYPSISSQTDSPAEGRLIYLKSSMTDDEDLPIREYRDRNNPFPHQTTADQFFDQDQFDAYRLLGNHICDDAFCELSGRDMLPDGTFHHFRDFGAFIDSVFSLHGPQATDRQSDVRTGSSSQNPF